MLISRIKFSALSGLCGSPDFKIRGIGLWLCSQSASQEIADEIETVAQVPKAMPGAVIRYCLLMTNNGRTSAPNATNPQVNVIAQVAFPVEMSYVADSILSGCTCLTAAAPEADHWTGIDECVPLTDCTIIATTAPLAPNATIAVTFRVTVD